MRISELKKEEGKRFNDSPYVYAFSLFLMMFGLIVCAWHIVDLLTTPPFNLSYTIATISALAITAFILLSLDSAVSKATSSE